MILRLSQKLAKKLKAGKLTDMPLDDNLFADWSCHLFTADRTQYIIPVQHGIALLVRYVVPLLAATSQSPFVSLLNNPG